MKLFIEYDFINWNEYIDIDTVLEFYKAWKGAGIFDNCGAAIVPCNVKVLGKESAQKYCDALQEVINKMDDSRWYKGIDKK